MTKVSEYWNNASAILKTLETNNNKSRPLVFYKRAHHALNHLQVTRTIPNTKSKRVTLSQYGWLLWKIKP